MLSAVVNAAEVAKVCRLDPKPYLCSDVSTPRDESISTLATCQWPRDAARARGSSRTTLSAHGQLPAILPRASRQRVRLLGASEAEVSAHLQGVVEVVSASLPASISASHRRACPASSNACRPSTQHSGSFFRLQSAAENDRAAAPAGDERRARLSIGRLERLNVRRPASAREPARRALERAVQQLVQCLGHAARV